MTMPTQLFSRRFLWLGAFCFWTMPIITDLVSSQLFLGGIRNPLSFQDKLLGLYGPAFLWWLYIPITVIVFFHTRIPGPRIQDWRRYLTKQFAIWVGFLTVYVPIEAAVQHFYILPLINDHQMMAVRSFLGKFFFYYLLNLAICQFIRFIHFQAQQSVQKAQLENQMLQAQLQLLQRQLQPHFLFNTLNAIAVLIRKQANQQALHTVQGLSDLLRTLLKWQDRLEVAFSEELEFLKRYLDIETLRFRDRFSYAFSVEPHLANAQIPPLIVQPLIENVMKHAVAPRSQATHLELSATREDDDLIISVEDNGPGIQSEDLEPGVGLEVTRQRLAKRFGREDLLTLTANYPQGVQASMRIPLALAAQPS